MQWGTTDLPILLTDTSHRTLLAAYELALSPVFKLCRQLTAADFRTQKTVRLGEMTQLSKVDEHGEITYGGVAEESESFQLATYAKLFALSRNAMINDDLGAFATMSSAQGRAAAETQNQLVVAMLTSQSGLGPTLTDTKKLYDAAHGNIGTAGVISLTTLTAGKLLMRSQKGVDGISPINAVPKYLLVPAGLETVARQGVATIYPVTSATVNPLENEFEVLVEPRLAGTRWYLFADPATMPVLEYAYLASAPGPQLQTRLGWEILGIEFRVILDFATSVQDWRGTITNAGA